VFVVVFGLLNGLHYWRNTATFGSPLGSRFIHDLELNAPRTLAGTASVLLRNVRLHSDTLIPPLTRALRSVVDGVHGWTGLSLRDPATTFPLPPEVAPDEEFTKVTDSVASCFYHLLLVVGAGWVGLLRWRRYPGLAVVCGLTVAGVVLFCALLRFQFWHARIHLTWFVLLAPVVGVVLVDQWGRRWRQLVGAGLLLLGLFTVGIAESRPWYRAEFRLSPSSRQYLLVEAPRLVGVFEEAASRLILPGTEEIGLVFGWNEIEYPLWVMLRERGFRGSIRHVGVTNESARLGTRYGRTPDVLVVRGAEVPSGLDRAFPDLEELGGLELRWPATLSPAQGEGL
jgi:hypothetical protein